KAKWPFGKLLWVLVSGTIPLAAFFVERRIRADFAGAAALDALRTVAARRTDGGNAYRMLARRTGAGERR
ncbi:hypothetical protein AB0F20_38580, partial [Streptomyces goshikiensis]